MANHKSKARELFVRASNEIDGGRLRSGFHLNLAAAKLGDSSAQVYVGYAYDVGLGIKRNRSAALYWYRRAYRHGERIAASNIATIYRDEGDLKKTLAWFERASRLGDGDAELEIAKLYLKSPKDIKKAISHLKRASRASASDVTLAAKEEAVKLLKKVELGIIRLRERSDRCPSPKSNAG